MILSASLGIRTSIFIANLEEELQLHAVFFKDSELIKLLILKVDTMPTQFTPLLQLPSEIYKKIHFMHFEPEANLGDVNTYEYQVGSVIWRMLLLDAVI